MGAHVAPAGGRCGLVLSARRAAVCQPLYCVPTVQLQTAAALSQQGRDRADLHQNRFKRGSQLSATQVSGPGHATQRLAIGPRMPARAESHLATATHAHHQPPSKQRTNEMRNRKRPASSETGTTKKHSECQNSQPANNRQATAVQQN